MLFEHVLSPERRTCTREREIFEATDRFLAEVENWCKLPKNGRLRRILSSSPVVPVCCSRVVLG